MAILGPKGPRLNASTRVHSAAASKSDAPFVGVAPDGPEVAPVAVGPKTPNFGVLLAEAGERSIESKMRRHLEAIEKTGFGVYYGSNSRWKRHPEEREGALGGVPRALTNSLTESDCITWAMENIGAAYNAVGAAGRWKEITRSVSSSGTTGAALAKELQKDGWEALYWQADADGTNLTDDERRWAERVNNGRGYFGIRIDRTMTGFRPNKKNGPPLMDDILRLRKVPFFFGLTSSGRHTHVGRYGEVNEFHRMNGPTTPDIISQTPLEKWERRIPGRSKLRAHRGCCHDGGPRWPAVRAVGRTLPRGSFSGRRPVLSLSLAET